MKNKFALIVLMTISGLVFADAERCSEIDKQRFKDVSDRMTVLFKKILDSGRKEKELMKQYDSLVASESEAEGYSSRWRDLDAQVESMRDEAKDIQSEYMKLSEEYGTLLDKCPSAEEEYGITHQQEHEALRQEYQSDLSE